MHISDTGKTESFTQKYILKTMPNDLIFSYYWFGFKEGQNQFFHQVLQNLIYYRFCGLDFLILNIKLQNK